MCSGLLNAQYNCTLYAFNLVSTEVDGSNSVVLLGICVPDKCWETGFMQYCGKNGSRYRIFRV